MKDKIYGPNSDTSKNDPVKPSPGQGPRGYPIGPTGGAPPGMQPGVNDPYTGSRPTDSPMHKPGTPSTGNPYRG